MTSERWSFDPAHSLVGFHVRHLMISNVHGRFDKWHGTLELDLDDPTRSRVEIEIDAASIDTREPQRDAHLRSPEFLDAAAHPRVTFRSTHVERLGLDDYELVGDITIRGVTQPLRFAVKQSAVVIDTDGNRRIAFQAAGAISRKDFGLVWNRVLETGGVMVGDRVTFAIEIEAVRVPESRQVPASERATSRTY